MIWWRLNVRGPQIKLQICGPPIHNKQLITNNFSSLTDDMRRLFQLSSSFFFSGRWLGRIPGCHTEKGEERDSALYDW